MTRPTPRTLGFLADIDGLRALAVLVVVLFHLKVPGFAGGYVGVDIFFVISGFLISGLLQQRIEQGNFSFSGFYANRIRRLVPPVLATVSATAVAAAFILQPHMLKAFALSAIGALASAANIVFFMEAGYWDANSDFKPLLHMWSLGVEEQFYLFWPAILALLLGSGRRGYLPGLIVLFAVSLTACILYTPINEAAAFYLLPFRVWQFCLGALTVAAWRHYRLPVRMNRLMRVLGLILCALATVTFDATTPFPGWAALLPSTGAALVLLASDDQQTSALLANHVARWLGKTSYSLYLVHWPPIALYRCLTLSEPDLSSQIGLAVLMLVLAIVLHYGIEARFYQRAHRPTGWAGVPLAAVGCSLLGVFIMMSAYRYPQVVALRDAVLTTERIAQYRKDRFQWVRNSCRIDKLDDRRFCPEQPPHPVLFIGNSHEPDAYNILATALGEHHRNNFVNFGSDNGCGQFEIVGDWVKAANVECQGRVEALWMSLETVDWQYVVYGAHRHDNALKAHFLRILQTIRARQPQVKIILVGDYIRTRVDCASLINQYGTPNACKRPENVDDFAAESEGNEVLREDFAVITDHFVDKVELLCRESRLEHCPTVTPDGAPMFVDQHHLTFEFARFVGRTLAAQSPDWLREMAATVTQTDAATATESPSVTR